MGMYLAVLAPLLALAVAGCGGDSVSSSDPSPPAWPSAQARTMKAGHAPTPFTPDQIREGCPSGRVSTFSFESAERGKGLLVFRFEDADAEGVSFTVEVLDEKRKSVAPARTSRSTWADLQSHASHEAAHTHVRDEVVEVPAGSFACLVYEVRDPDAEGEVMTRYDFARTLPGMPIRVIQTKGGEVVSRQELLTDER